MRAILRTAFGSPEKLVIREIPEPEGGLAPIADFNPLLQMASGVFLTFYGSFVFGQPSFPLSDVPL
jgi:hypothetical protein